MLNLMMRRKEGPKSISNPNFVPELQPTTYIREKPEPPKSLHPTDFQEVAVVGQGAFGQVVLSTFVPSGNVYAVKKITKERMSGALYYAHLCDEFEVLKRLDSRYVTRFHAAYLSPTHVHFVMEYVAGGNFRDLLNKMIKLDEDTVRFYAAELFLGILYLHKKNIVHRDLKCDNLLLTKEGHLKICDFGLARTRMTDTTLDDNFCGTTSMKAKEIIRHERYTRSVDWWSYGIILFQLAFGSNPLDAGTLQETKERIKEFRMDQHRCDEIPWSVKHLTNHLVVDRKERYTPLQIRSHFLFSPQYWVDIEAGNIRPPFSGEIEVQGDHSNEATLVANKPLEIDVEDGRFDKFVYMAPGDL